ncbi:MAG: NUDIX domain-containing protein [Nanoarchaeota archaeon]|nr:NUDIX domain-containing protein [Nanoarchaeota archaeon]
MINATMCFLKDKEKILFIYRNKGDNDIHNGRYVPPGGKTERGERGIDCIKREFKEEVGLSLLSNWV